MNLVDIRKKHFSVIIQNHNDGCCFTLYRPTSKVHHSGYGMVIGLKHIAMLVEIR